MLKQEKTLLSSLKFVKLQGNKLRNIHTSNKVTPFKLEQLRVRKTEFTEENWIFVVKESDARKDTIKAGVYFMQHLKYMSEFCPEYLAKVLYLHLLLRTLPPPPFSFYLGFCVCFVTTGFNTEISLLYRRLDVVVQRIPD